MSRKSKAEKRKNLFLLVILAAFLLFTIPYICIPFSIGTHTYTGGLSRQGTSEAVEPASLTLSGTRTYALQRRNRIVEGDAHVTIGSISQGCSLYSRAMTYPSHSGWYEANYALNAGPLFHKSAGTVPPGQLCPLQGPFRRGDRVVPG